MSADGTRRYMIPTDAPGYELWKAKPLAHQGDSVLMKLPTGKDAATPNPGGLKHERAVRGNTFTYLVVALASVVENMRQMLSFYKRKLAIKSVTAKNRELPGTFWQSAGPALIIDEDL